MLNTNKLRSGFFMFFYPDKSVRVTLFVKKALRFLPLNRANFLALYECRKEQSPFD
jgi:hypothetical protein